MMFFYYSINFSNIEKCVKDMKVSKQKNIYNFLAKKMKKNQLRILS